MPRRCSTTTRFRFRVVCLACGVVLLSEAGQAQPADPLYEAIRYGRMDFVRDYLERGGDPNAPISDAEGNLLLPLDVALYPRREDIALLLLEAGADFEEGTADLRLVASEGMPRALALLFSQAPERLERAAGTASGERDYVLQVTTGYYQVLDAVFAARTAVMNERWRVWFCSSFNARVQH